MQRVALLLDALGGCFGASEGAFVDEGGGEARVARLRVEKDVQNPRTIVRTLPGPPWFAGRGCWPRIRQFCRAAQRASSFWPVAALDASTPPTARALATRHATPKQAPRRRDLPTAERNAPKTITTIHCN